MATYVVSVTDSDWGEVKDRFKTRPAADKRLKEEIAAGNTSARLIRWERGKATQVYPVP
jgi:hypothetical protein